MSSTTQDPNALKEQRKRIRHTAAHIMAEAVLFFYPGAKLAHGPATDDGFYYDIEIPHPITLDDLTKIEAKMKEIIKRNDRMVMKELTREEAKVQFKANPFKLETIDSIPPGEKITTYSQGSFTDLCEGPHVDYTGRIKAIKLQSIAGAYWKGDEKNPQLQRLYGTSFESSSALEAYLKMLEEAAKRDHRKLGRELNLFMFDPVSPASPFFFPKGTLVYNLLVEYVRGLYPSYGYEEVITPQIFASELWKKSGHYDNYKDNMFFVDVEEREFGVKPMNCPAHIMMYASQLHSYRDLPVRYADFGRLHRYERSGVTHGLTRVRSLSQDDAHIFCRLDQVEDEVKSFIQMLKDSYRIFGFNDFITKLALRPEKRLGTDQTWDTGEQALASAMTAAGIDFEKIPGEGAFYGPKIEFHVKDAIGREWQLGTVQLDFMLPERFEIEYVAEDGTKARPVMIHRALLGSLERFMGILIEHTAGAFPLWLAPVQAVVVPIADRHNGYAKEVREALKEAGFRANVDDRSERMNLKIREAQLQKVPFMFVVGDKEEAEKTVAVRSRTGEAIGTIPLSEQIAKMRKHVNDRA